MANILQFRPAIAALASTDSELMVRELVAKRIIRLARRGECDPQHLCSSALSGFRKPRTAA